MSSTKVNAQCAVCGDMMKASRKEAEENDKLYCSDCLVYTNCEDCGDRLVLGQDRFIELNKSPRCLDCAGSKGRARNPSQASAQGGNPTSKSTGRTRSILVRLPMKIVARIIGLFAGISMIFTVLGGIRFLRTADLTILGGSLFGLIAAIWLLLMYNLGNWGLRYEP